MNFTLIPIISQTYSLHFLISHYSLSITYPGNAHIGDYPIYIHKFNRIPQSGQLYVRLPFFPEQRLFSGQLVTGTQFVT